MHLERIKQCRECPPAKSAAIETLALKVSVLLDSFRDILQFDYACYDLLCTLRKLVSNQLNENPRYEISGTTLNPTLWYYLAKCISMRALHIQA